MKGLDFPERRKVINIDEIVPATIIKQINSKFRPWPMRHYMRNECLFRLIPVKCSADITPFNIPLDFSDHSRPVYAFPCSGQSAHNSTVGIMRTILRRPQRSDLGTTTLSPLTTTPS